MRRADQGRGGPLTGESRQYEVFVRDIYEVIAGLSGLGAGVVRHDAKVVGLSGQPHQIDVLWEFSLGDERRRTVIECKRLNRPVGVGVVKELDSTVRDLGPGSSGIVASWSGFQSGAVRLARATGIRLVEITRGLRRLEIQVTDRGALKVAGVHLTFDPRSEAEAGGDPRDRELSALPNEPVFSTADGARLSLLGLLGRDRRYAGVFDIVCDDLYADTHVGRIKLASLQVHMEQEREPETQILRIDVANPARAVVCHILEGYDLTVTADGAVERVSRATSGDLPATPWVRP